jgi:NAD(P)-dependent dehydrogenase (short-subunit alcohol dehydrogenase family)
MVKQAGGECIPFKADVTKEAALALFLASDGANHITGVELLVDGGRALKVG